ncbi:MAG: hemerythrin domain-containing protein [Solirubrobacterales bacterium]
MKRDEALQSLSRDHHQALVIARLLRREADRSATLEGFLRFWRQHGAIHFRIEEEVLLPAWAEAGPVDEALVTSMLLDHLWIRTRARRLAGGEPDPPQLEELGERLAAHVRLEEREVFPAIERALDTPALATAVAEAEAAAVA